MRDDVHCLLPSAYRRHATRSMRGACPYVLVLNATPQMQAHVSASDRPLVKSEGIYPGARVGGQKHQLPM